MPHGTLPGYFKDLRRPSEQAGVDTPAAGEPPGPLPAPPPRGAIPGSGAAAEPHPPVPHQNQTGEREAANHPAAIKTAGLFCKGPRSPSLQAE